LTKDLKKNRSQAAAPTPLLDLVQVRTFVAVADAGSFSAAAERLGLSQPAVSQHVGKLEASLGVQLLRRDRGTCALTAEGEALLPQARGLLAAELRCRASLGAVPLSVAASTNIGTYHLPRILRRFQARGEAPAVNVAVGTNLDVYRRVERQEVDVGLTEWWDKRDNLAAVQWHDEPLIVIVGKDHPWASRKSVGAAELLATPMIGGEAGTGTASILRALFPEAKDLRVSMTLGSTEAVKQAVIAGLGISLVMKAAVESEIRDGRLVALPVTGRKIRKPLFAVYQRGLTDLGSAGKFLSFIKTGRLAA
jgi:DNA-binding transcriptional LysR family regulator